MRDMVNAGRILTECGYKPHYSVYDQAEYSVRWIRNGAEIETQIRDEKAQQSKYLHDPWCMSLLSMQ